MKSPVAEDQNCVFIGGVRSSTTTDEIKRE